MSGWCATPQTGKAKEEGKVGLVSQMEESSIFTVKASRLSEADMDIDHYDGRRGESEPRQVGEYDTDTGDMGNECRPGQFTCLGRIPSFVNWHGYCELCKGHFRV